MNQAICDLCLIKGFNPCFSGCTSSIRIACENLTKPDVVSILVLVDVPLQFFKGDRVSDLSIVSILVLVDVPLQFQHADTNEKEEL